MSFCWSWYSTSFVKCFANIKETIFFVFCLYLFYLTCFISVVSLFEINFDFASLRCCWKQKRSRCSKSNQFQFACIQGRASGFRTLQRWVITTQRLDAFTLFGRDTNSPRTALSSLATHLSNTNKRKMNKSANVTRHGRQQSCYDTRYLRYAVTQS